MKFVAVELSDFRNLAYALVEPHPRFTIFWGDNGHGKTNLLEALYLVGTLRSFRASRTDELVRFGAERASVRARTERSGTPRRVEVNVAPGTKTMRVDGKAVRSTDYSSGVNVVLFAPDDLQIPRGAPSLRRRFVDRAVWNVAPAYLAEAQKYERLLRNRNALLREDKIDPALLMTFDEQLSTAAVPIVERRAALVAALAPRVKTIVSLVLGGDHAIEMAYRSALGPTNIRETLLALYQRDRVRDRARGVTSSGPHTDDLTLLLDGKPAAAFASQGQARTIVLALKIAEIAEIEAQLGDAPVLLLDDVSSELDAGRNAQLFEYLRSTRCQTFISTTHPQYVLIDQDRKDFHVVGGSIAS